MNIHDFFFINENNNIFYGNKCAYHHLSSDIKIVKIRTTNDNKKELD